MHELSLAQHICEVVREHAPANSRVAAVVVECGPLSGVVPSSLSFCFDMVAQQCGFGEAELKLVELSAPASCPSCQKRFEVQSMWAECPSCGHAPVAIEGGRDFRLRHIEIEER